MSTTSTSTAITAVYLEKIQKCIRLLASDKDGERQAAVGALGRVLGNNGLCFDDLAELLNSDLAESAYQNGRERGYEEGYRQAELDGRKDARRASNGEHGASSSALYAVARACADHIDQFTDEQAEFVRSMVRVTGCGWSLTPRQEKYLRDLHARLRWRR